MTSERKRIAVIASRAPIPRFESGSTLRLYPILEYLASRHDTGLLLTADRRMGVDCREAVEAAFPLSVVRSVDPGLSTALRRRVASFSQLLQPPFPPWEAIDPALRLIVPGIVHFLEEFRPAAVLWYAGPLAYLHAVRTRMGRTGARHVIDWIDSWSLTMANRQGWPRWKRTYTSRRCATFERRVSRAADASIYITQRDAESSQPHRDGGLRPHVIPNGFQQPEGRPGSALRDAPTIGFLGNMGYDPNVEAVLRLHRSVFVPLRMAVPDLRLRVIGRGPAPQVSALARHPGVEVTGAVDSIWPHLEKVSVMVFPMDSGAGLQNKVLDAMAARRPVVTTRLCAAGLGDGYESAVALAETDEEFLVTTRRLLLHPEECAALVERGDRLLDRFRWEEILPRYESVVLGP